jgi:hypothetical protein
MEYVLGLIVLVIIAYILYVNNTTKEDAGVKLDQSAEAPYKVEAPAANFPVVRPEETVKEDPAPVAVSALAPKPAAKKAPAKKVGEVAAKTAKAADKAAKKAPAKKAPAKKTKKASV